MASPSMSTESARSAVEWPTSPATSSTTNMTGWSHRTIVKIRRWRFGMSDRKSQHSSMTSVCSGRVGSRRHSVSGPAVHDPDAGRYRERADRLEQADRFAEHQPGDQQPEHRRQEDEHVDPSRGVRADEPDEE